MAGGWWLVAGGWWPGEGQADGAVEMRVLLDRSSLEVFVNGQPLSARVGAEPTDDRVLVGARGLTGGRLRAWTMGEAYSSRPAPTVAG